jgi:hypothetical protein
LPYARGGAVLGNYIVKFGVCGGQNIPECVSYGRVEPTTIVARLPISPAGPFLSGTFFSCNFIVMNVFYT